jgi:hypothetical protein
LSARCRIFSRGAPAAGPPSRRGGARTFNLEKERGNWSRMFRWHDAWKLLPNRATARGEQVATSLWLPAIVGSYVILRTSISRNGAQPAGHRAESQARPVCPTPAPARPRRHIEGIVIRLARPLQIAARTGAPGPPFRQSESEGARLSARCFSVLAPDPGKCRPARRIAAGQTSHARVDLPVGRSGVRHRPSRRAMAGLGEITRAVRRQVTGRAAATGLRSLYRDRNCSAKTINATPNMTAKAPSHQVRTTAPANGATIISTP